MIASELWESIIHKYLYFLLAGVNMPKSNEKWETVKGRFVQERVL